MIKYGFSVLTLLFCVVMSGIAQQTLDLNANNYNSKVGLVYSTENTFDIRLHTNGASLGLNFGQIESYYKTSFWHFDIGELKHARETKQSRSLQGGALGGSFRSFVYGKQNNFFTVRGGYGQKKYLSEKARFKGVAVGLSYEGGPTIGVTKPYYLILRYVSENFGQLNYRSEKYSEENAARFLANENIFGADSFTRGLTEVGIIPGIHASASLHFDFGTFDEFVKAVEVGAMVDFFFKEVPIMIESPVTPELNNQMAFINLFINVQFGKRK